VVVIHARSNKLKDLEHHLPALEQLLGAVLDRRIYHIGFLRLLSGQG